MFLLVFSFALLFAGSTIAEENELEIYRSPPKWPNAVIPYYTFLELDGFNYFGSILVEALSILESRTCIQFVRINKTNTVSPYLFVLTEEQRVYDFQRNEIPVIFSLKDGVADAVHRIAVAIVPEDSSIVATTPAPVQEKDNNETSIFDKAFSILGILKRFGEYKVDYNEQTSPRFSDSYPYTSSEVRSELKEIYECPICSKTFRAEFGAAKPLTIDRDEDCEYRFTVPSDHFIVFETVDDEVCESKPCEYASFDLYEGDRRLTKYIGRMNSQTTPCMRTEGNKAVVIKPASNNSDIKLSSLHFLGVKVKKLTKPSGQIESTKELPQTFTQYWQVWTINVTDESKFYVNITKFMIEGEKDDCLQNSTGLIRKEQLSVSDFERQCGNHSLKISRLFQNQVQIQLIHNTRSRPVVLLGNYASFYHACFELDHGCHHYCEDLIEDFKCGCDEGYELGPDGKTCLGGWTDFTVSSAFWTKIVLFFCGVIALCIIAVISRKVFGQHKQTLIITEKAEKLSSP